MRRWTLLALLIVVSISAAAIRRGGERRPVPMDPADYYIPRSVGVNLQIPDMSQHPILWWQPGIPVVQSFDYLESLDIRAVGLMMRAHPTEKYWENIRKAFRHPAIDVIVVRPEFWGSQDFKCVDDWQEQSGILWENYPMEIFDMFYQYYAHQDKDIIVINAEADWQAYGLACRERDQCIRDGRYGRYFRACEAGVLVSYDTDATNCAETACDMVKMDRAARLLEIMLARQRAAEEARERYPNAKLRVFHAIEVNMFGNKPWQFMTSLEEIVSVVKPDFVGLSMYQGADPVDGSLAYAMDVTGLPAWRFFISEVGSKENRDGQQYDRITSVVDTLFDRGVAFALVWDIENHMSYDTGFSVVDRDTGEWYSGMYAIQDLNDRWR
jgi:hypothetical protein